MGLPRYEVSWDPAKAKANLVKHDVPFAEAASILLDSLSVAVFDAAHSDLEERWFTLGRSAAGRLLAVSHTVDGCQSHLDSDYFRATCHSA